MGPSHWSPSDGKRGTQGSSGTRLHLVPDGSVEKHSRVNQLMKLQDVQVVSGLASLSWSEQSLLTSALVLLPL